MFQVLLRSLRPASLIWSELFRNFFSHLNSIYQPYFFSDLVNQKLNKSSTAVTNLVHGNGYFWDNLLEKTSYEWWWQFSHYSNIPFIMFWTDIARFLQYFRNLSNSFINIFAILQDFDVIFLKYSFNITVLCGYDIKSLGIQNLKVSGSNPILWNITSASTTEFFFSFFLCNTIILIFININTSHYF